MSTIFIQKAKNIHEDKYDYSKLNYVNAHTKVTIICKIHGHFEQTPANHLNTKGCNKCVDRTKRRSNIEDFIEKARKVHGYKYDYSKFIYINATTKGIIICRNKHGVFEFEQKACAIPFLSGAGQASPRPLAEIFFD